MGYSLEEHLVDGQKIVLGEPFVDLRVAKVIALRRAMRTGRIVVINEEDSHREIARYEPGDAPPSSMRSAFEAFGSVNRSAVRRKTTA